MNISVSSCGPGVAHTLSSAAALVSAAPKGTGKGAGKGGNSMAASPLGLQRNAGRDDELKAVVERAKRMGQDFPVWKGDKKKVMKGSQKLWMHGDGRGEQSTCDGKQGHLFTLSNLL